MLSLDDCRKILGNRANPSDEELARLRDQMYGLTEVILDSFERAGGAGVEEADRMTFRSVPESQRN